MYGGTQGIAVLIDTIGSLKIIRSSVSGSRLQLCSIYQKQTLFQGRQSSFKNNLFFKKPD